MDNSSSLKVRLVKCPKCRLFLPEHADLPVYMCGGCCTVLQVKNRKKNDVKSKSTSSGSPELDAANKNVLDHVSEVTESISSSSKASLLSSGECSLTQNNGMDQNISMDYDVEKFGAVNSSDEDRNNKGDDIETQNCNIEQSGGFNEFCSSTGPVYREGDELSPLGGPNSEVVVTNESSRLVDEKSVADIDNESGSTFRSSNADNHVARMDMNSTVTSHRPAGESISSDILISSLDEQQEQLQSVHDHYDHISSELSGTLDCMSKSPTTRSSHAYDGSISSYDGIDDQVPNEQINSYKSNYKVLNSVVTEERSTTDNFLKNRHSELQHQERNCSPLLSEERHYPLNRRKWGPDELLESTIQGCAVRNGTILGRDELVLSSVPFCQKNYPAGYESGSSSSQLHDDFHLRSSEQEKIKLLRMVYDLQDQLKKKCYVNEKTNRIASPGLTMKEKYVPPFYSGEIPEKEIFPGLNYRMLPEIHSRGSNWSHQYNVSRISYSGEATKNRHHIDSSYMHCCPQNWQCLAPLPPPNLSHNKGFRRFHPGHSCYSSCRSCPSSPQRFTDPEFPLWCRETKSEDQMHNDHHTKKFVREKHHLVKQHLRPTVGGAPFITCYVCLKALKLPADFLLFKRKFHQLRCGACSEVLKFSLENRTHLLPYTQITVAPPSEIDDYSDAINRRSLASSSHANDCAHADPVSCSDDYGLSYCKSYSTDGDPVLPTTFDNVHGSADARDISYGSSDSLEERQQLALKQSRNKYRNPVETYESAGPSSNKSRPMKVSSEIEELPAKTGSPLYRLMDYSSPSQVIRGSGRSGSGTSSYYMHT